MVVVGTGGIGSKYLKRNYPNELGLEAGITKQEGEQTCLNYSYDLLEEDTTGL